MPWNFPLWQAMRFAAPALMAGNVGLLKHASNVPQTALFLEELFTRAGFPDGRVPDPAHRLVQGGGVLRDHRVVAVTLTGSGPAGSAVAAIAGDEVKKSVLELGGSDPFIVMPSADLHGRPRWRPRPGASTTASPASRPSGSSSTTRWPTSSSACSSTGWPRGWSATPWTTGTDVGPLASEQQRKDIVELVEDAAGPRGGGPLRRRRPRRSRLVLPADRADRHHPGHAHPHRGGLRPGGHPLPGLLPGGGRRAGQRHRVRARGQRLDRPTRRSRTG